MNILESNDKEFDLKRQILTYDFSYIFENNQNYNLQKFIYSMKTKVNLFYNKYYSIHNFLI